MVDTDKRHRRKNKKNSDNNQRPLSRPNHLSLDAGVVAVNTEQGERGLAEFIECRLRHQKFSYCSLINGTQMLSSDASRYDTVSRWHFITVGNGQAERIEAKPHSWKEGNCLV